MVKFKVGDRVRIVHTDYKGQCLEIGTVHEVMETGLNRVFLESKTLGRLCFLNHEVEPVEYTCTIQLNHQYTSKNGQKWECIAVRGDTAWLVAENGKGAAYTFKLDGANICQGGGEWDIKWEPVVEWVDVAATYDPERSKVVSGHAFNSGYHRINIRFPLIDGKPDFTQANVTPV